MNNTFCEPLPASGRSVSVQWGSGDEQLEIRSPQGEIELQITLTPEGPVVNLRCARLQIESSDAVSVLAKRFDVFATEGVGLYTAGEMRLSGQTMRATTAGNIHMDGEKILLNCSPERACEPTGGAECLT